jgi:hypothetical protein
MRLICHTKYSSSETQYCHRTLTKTGELYHYKMFQQVQRVRVCERREREIGGKHILVNMK